MSEVKIYIPKAGCNRNDSFFERPFIPYLICQPSPSRQTVSHGPTRERREATMHWKSTKVHVHSRRRFSIKSELQRRVTCQVNMACRMDMAQALIRKGRKSDIAVQTV